MRLLLFFTRNVSLRTWEEVGNLDREVALYRRLGGMGVDVGFVTYGGRRDRSYQDRLDGIRVLPIRGGVSSRQALAELLLCHGHRIARSDVLKTNQIPGAHLAVRCKQLLGKRLVVRSGYPYSWNTREGGGAKGEVAEALRLEQEAFAAGDAVVVTSPSAQRYAIETHALPPEKVRVIPNYVDTESFRPMPDVEKHFDLVHVGRSSAEKNQIALLRALAQLKARGREVSLLLLGGAAADPDLRALAERERLAVTFQGSVPNEMLPSWLNSSRAFILPSLFEGHPKALLEAMSCGLPCIGAKVRGITDVLRHNDTGYLCGTSPSDIAQAVETLLDDNAGAARLGDRARRHVLEDFSLDTVAAAELALLQEVVRAGNTKGTERN